LYETSTFINLKSFRRAWKARSERLIVPEYEEICGKSEKNYEIGGYYAQNPWIFEQQDGF
jgi:hypothetical protein